MNVNTKFTYVYSSGLNVKNLFRLDIIEYDEVTKLLKMRVIMLNSGIYPVHELDSARDKRRALIAETMHYFFKVDKLETCKWIAPSL